MSTDFFSTMLNPNLQAAMSTAGFMDLSGGGIGEEFAAILGNAGLQNTGLSTAEQNLLDQLAPDERRKLDRFALGMDLSPLMSLDSGLGYLSPNRDKKESASSFTAMMQGLIKINDLTVQKMIYQVNEKVDREAAVQNAMRAIVDILG